MSLTQPHRTPAYQTVPDTYQDMARHAAPCLTSPREAIVGRKENSNG